MLAPRRIFRAAFDSLPGLGDNARLFSLDMFNAAQFSRLVHELILFFLGAMLILLGASGRFALPRRSATWIVLGAALVLWGVRSAWRASSSGPMWSTRVRGVSFALVGAVMLAAALAPRRATAPLLEAAGGVLALRSIVSAALAIRTP